MRGQEPTHWRLAEVEPPERATMEMELPGAVVRFAWTYEELSEGRTRLTQHLVLEGPGAGAFFFFLFFGLRIILVDCFISFCISTFLYSLVISFFWFSFFLST